MSGKKQKIGKINAPIVIKIGGRLVLCIRRWRVEALKQANAIGHTPCGNIALLWPKPERIQGRILPAVSVKQTDLFAIF